MSLGIKQVTMSGENLITLSIKSNTNFEENARCSTQRAFSEDMISFLNKNNAFN